MKNINTSYKVYFKKYVKLFLISSLIIFLSCFANLFFSVMNYTRYVEEQVNNKLEFHDKELFNYYSEKNYLEELCREVKCEFSFLDTTDVIKYKNLIFKNPKENLIKLTDSLYYFKNDYNNFTDLLVKTQDLYIAYNLGHLVYYIFISYVFTWLLNTGFIFFIFWRLYVREQKTFEYISTESLNILSMSNTLSIAENIHHEINTPLEVIKNKVRKLEKDFNKKDLVFIDTAIQQITSILEKLKVFKKIKLEKINVMNLYEISEVAFESVSITHGDIDYEITNNLKKYKVKYLSDGDVINILINHIKNSIEAISTEIKITAQNYKNGFLIIDIEDDGNGITQEHLGKLFSPNSSKKGKYRGNGLYINKTILNSVNGDLFLKRTSCVDTYNQKRGTCFSLKIPVEIEG